MACDRNGMAVSILPLTTGLTMGEAPTRDVERMRAVARIYMLKDLEIAW